MLVPQQRISTTIPAPATFMPQAGDWVKVFLPRLGVEHEGIVVQAERMYGGFQAVIAHNSKGNGAIQSSWLDFSEGQAVRLHRRAESQAHVNQILQRVYGNLGVRYALLDQNCQHFASFAFTGQSESPSVKFVGGLAAVAVLAALFG